MASWFRGTFGGKIIIGSDISQMDGPFDFDEKPEIND